MGTGSYIVVEKQRYELSSAPHGAGRHHADQAGSLFNMEDQSHQSRR
jgi:hypothetical protein